MSKETLTIRITKEQMEALEALPGSRAEVVRNLIQATLCEGAGTLWERYARACRFVDLGRVGGDDGRA